VFKRKDDFAEEEMDIEARMDEEGCGQ